MSACIASILDIPLSEVPYFVGMGERWFAGIISWLRERNLCIARYHPRCGRVGAEAGLGFEGIPKGWSLMSGPSVRGSWGHMVVAFDGQLFHDPHPEGGGLKDNIVWDYMQIVPHGTPDPEGGYVLDWTDLTEEEQQT